MRPIERPKDIVRNALMKLLQDFENKTQCSDRTDKAFVQKRDNARTLPSLQLGMTKTVRLMHDLKFEHWCVSNRLLCDDLRRKRPAVFWCPFSNVGS